MTRARTSRSAERIESVEARWGHGDVLDGLVHEHRMIERLFAQASLLDDGERWDAVREITDLLRTHTAVEDEAVYPMVGDRLPGGDLLVGRSRDDHRLMADLVADLERLGAHGGATTATDDVTTIELTDLLARLQLIVQAHVAVEEGVLWPAYRAVVEPSVLAELGEEAERARQAAPTRPHPHSPDTPPGNIVAGAVAGAVDRVRDVVTGRDEPERGIHRGPDDDREEREG